MSIKMVTCVICGQEVTKKSTLDLASLGVGTSGRGCRSHQEVAEVDTQKREKRLELMSRAEAIRQEGVDRWAMPLAEILVEKSLKEGILSKDLIYTYFTAGKEKVITRAIEMAINRGAKILSEEEIINGLGDGSIQVVC